MLVYQRVSHQGLLFFGSIKTMIKRDKWPWFENERKISFTQTLPDPSGPFRTLPDRCLGEASATFFGSPLRCHASFVPSITSVPPWQCMPWILVDCWGFPMFSCGFTMVFSMAKPIINYNKLIDFKFWSSFEGFHPFLMELGGLFFITRGTSKEFLTQLPPPKKKNGLLPWPFHALPK